MNEEVMNTEVNAAETAKAAQEAAVAGAEIGRAHV